MRYNRLLVDGADLLLSQGGAFPTKSADSSKSGNLRIHDSALSFAQSLSSFGNQLVAGRCAIVESAEKPIPGHVETAVVAIEIAVMHMVKKVSEIESGRLGATKSVVARVRCWRT